MNWQDIEVSSDNTFFHLNGTLLFQTKFDEVLKFHTPGLAPVKDSAGAYHIDVLGKPLYIERYDRTFGFYCNRAAVTKNKLWFHITETGQKAYSEIYSWTGNFQENICTVRDFDNFYFHIDKKGERIYENKYRYCGDFKDGYACVKKENGYYVHIDSKGNPLNNKEFLDLGVFHKNYATARDEKGWFHIDKNGQAIYSERYLIIEPFYNGFALGTDFEFSKMIINEEGEIVLFITH